MATKNTACTKTTKTSTKTAQASRKGYGIFYRKGDRWIGPYRSKVYTSKPSELIVSGVRALLRREVKVASAMA